MIGDDSQGHSQKVEYETWSSFCLFYAKIGHEEDDCFKKDPLLKPLREAGDNQGTGKKIYVPKKLVTNTKVQEEVTLADIKGVDAGQQAVRDQAT